jgi:uncharacterized protein (TIGR02453 family)
MSAVCIPASALEFIKKVAKNNNRDWFAKHKEQYLREYEHLVAFSGALLHEMNRHDHIETPSGKDMMFRIYRDTRFSKNKTPYKDHWAGRMKRATRQLRGGYYFEIKPGGHSLAAGGFFAPNPADLLRIRQDIDYNAAAWNKLLSAKKTAATLGPLRGQRVSTAPRGFAKDHPAIALLQHKQFYFERYFTDAEVLHPNFVKQLSGTFKTMRPWLNYMSDVLTTDLNGESLL